MQVIQVVPIIPKKIDMTSPARSFGRALAYTAVVPVCALLIMTGCNRGHSADVVATVNGHAVMKADLEKAYKAQLGEAQQQQQPSQEQADSLRLNVLQALINEEIVEQRATKMNLTATNEEVDAKLAEMKAPYTEEQFNERLKANSESATSGVDRNWLAVWEISMASFTAWRNSSRS